MKQIVILMIAMYSYVASAQPPENGINKAGRTVQERFTAKSSVVDKI